MKTTLNKIRAKAPCTYGWQKLLGYLNKTKADDTDLSIAEILKNNGIDDALWCLQAVDGYDKEKRLFAVWCARQVEHLNKDPRVKAANDAAEVFANGLISGAASDAASDAAWAAARAAQSVMLAYVCGQTDAGLEIDWGRN